MPAPKGNQFWKLRSKHGREKLFASPDLLWESACEYFQWCDENPWLSTETTTSDKGTFTKEKPTQRPYSRMGWFLYIGCSDAWLKEFKKTADKDFLLVIEQIEQSIDKQQWEGASVGAFNANIIARTLGLKDHSDVTTNGKDVTISPITPEEAQKRLEKINGSI
jgi:hypothetical protein